MDLQYSYIIPWHLIRQFPQCQDHISDDKACLLYTSRRIFGLLLAICIAGGLLPVSTMPVAAAADPTVTIGGKEFITDSSGIMAYRYNNDAYDDYTFDIYGKFGGEWKQTTYDSSGYYTYIKIADSSKFVQAVSSVDNGYTISDTGLNVCLLYTSTVSLNNETNLFIVHLSLLPLTSFLTP